ncbi:MAG: head GIN domain-containing protein [Bacteroidia bacterium]
MKHFLSISACVIALLSQAQTTEKRDISTFNKIDASGATSISFKTSDAVSLSVEADAAEIKNVETFVKNNVLYIKTKGEFKHPVKVNVSAATFKELHLSGASSFVSSGEIKTDSMSVESSGASSVNMALVAKAVHTKLAGASSASFSGNTQRFYAKISGASTLKAFDLKSAVASVDAAGASTANVYASQKLNGNCSGASNIKFKGDPKDVYKRSTEASQIDSVN